MVELAQRDARGGVQLLRGVVGWIVEALEVGREAWTRVVRRVEEP